jgi:hypothetical protein
VKHEAVGGRTILDDVLQGLQRRLVAAVVVGLLAFGVPSTRADAFRVPPALVRVQSGPSAGAEAWRQFFAPLRAEPN